MANYDIDDLKAYDEAIDYVLACFEELESAASRRDISRFYESINDVYDRYQNTLRWDGDYKREFIAHSRLVYKLLNEGAGFDEIMDWIAKWEEYTIESAQKLDAAFDSLSNETGQTYERFIWKG